MTFAEYQKQWEDAAANAVGHGGIAMPADMMPKDKHKKHKDRVKKSMYDGRTKEEAQMVVHNGEKAVRSLAIQKHPTTWTDKVINELPKNDWIGNIFYRNNIVRRCNLVREYYQSMPVETMVLT